MKILERITQTFFPKKEQQITKVEVKIDIAKYKEKIEEIVNEYGIKEYKTEIVKPSVGDEKSLSVVNIYFEDMEIMRNILINKAPTEIEWSAGGQWDEGRTEYLIFKTKDDDIRLKWYGYASSAWGGLFSKTKEGGFWENEMYGYKNFPDWPGTNKGKYIKEKPIF